jgi:hypothetical protein
VDDDVRPVTRRLRVEWRHSSDISYGAVITDVGSGEDVSDYIPISEGAKLLHSQRTGEAVDITLFLLRDGHPFVIAPEEIATRTCMVQVIP